MPQMLVSEARKEVKVFQALGESKKGMLPQAEAMLQRMDKAGVVPNARSYNPLILEYAKRCDLRSAQRIFNGMIEAGVLRDEVTYRFYLSACRNVRDWDLQVSTFKHMLDEGIAPSERMWSWIGPKMTPKLQRLWEQARRSRGAAHFQPRRRGGRRGGRAGLQRQAGLCRTVQKGLRCRFGDRCRFLHGPVPPPGRNTAAAAPRMPPVVAAPTLGCAPGRFAARELQALHRNVQRFGQPSASQVQALVATLGSKIKSELQQCAPVTKERISCLMREHVGWDLRAGQPAAGLARPVRLEDVTAVLKRM